MLWQALQECTGSLQTQARWRLAARTTPGTQRAVPSVPGAEPRRGRGAGSGLCALLGGGGAGGGCAVRTPARWLGERAGRDPRSGSPSERTGREQRPSAGPGDLDTPGQKPLKSQAHGAPARPALPREASPRSPPGVEAATPLALRSRRPGTPGRGDRRSAHAALGSRATPSLRRLGRRPAAAPTPAGPHPASVGSVRRVEPPEASDGVRCLRRPEVGRCWRHMAPTRTSALCVMAQPPEAGSRRKSLNGCGRPGLRAGCRVLP